MITIQNLSVSYGAQKVLDNFDLHLEKGGLYALLGPSGSGKSTLLKTLCGIKKDYTGTIDYKGRPLAAQKLPVGYVPQNYGLLDWKTARENIYLPVAIRGDFNPLNGQMIAGIVSVLQIDDLLHKYPGELSGGQKQRVALARAFALEPELLLMDEPFSALDAFTSAACQKLFLAIWAEHQVTSLFITHNISEAVASAKTILLMDNHTRRISKVIQNHAFGGEEMAKLTLTAEIMAHVEDKQLNRRPSGLSNQGPAGLFNQRPDGL